MENAYLAGYLVTSYRFLLLASVIWLFSIPANIASALDLNLRDTLGVYTGHQFDDRGQYYSYAGATLPLSTKDPDSLVPFIDIFAARQKYFIKDGNNYLPSYLSVYTAAVGVTKRFNQFSVSLSAGPAFQSSTDKYSYQEQAQTFYGEVTTQQLGYVLSSYSSYTMRHHRFEAILSYSSLQDVYFGRARWKHVAYKKRHGFQMEINPGLESLALGNERFQSVATGGLIEARWKRFGVLVRGGYQYTTAFHHGQYIGIELFGTPF